MIPLIIANLKLFKMKVLYLTVLNTLLIAESKMVTKNPGRYSQQIHQDPQGFPFHPLDPLSAGEIQLTAQVIKQTAPNVPWVFSYITLKEPEKSSLLGHFLADTAPPSGSIPRRSFSLVIDKTARRSFEVVVDLRQRKVESWTEIPKGLQPMFAFDEFDPAYDALIKDERVVSRLRALGWTNLTNFVPDLWNFGYDGDRPEFQGKRMTQVFMYGRNFEKDNFYAHPMGFIALFDLDTYKVVGFENLPIQSDFDTSNRNGDSIPLTPHNYDPAILPAAFYRKDVSPIRFSQPGGPSYKVRADGNQIEWQKFKMRLGFAGREGLILYNINYNDNGKVRPLIYRASASELFVPYGDPRPPLHRKMAFDAGQYGLGFSVNELHSPSDCKGSVHFFDAVGNTGAGAAVIFRNAICVYEEDVDSLWKKQDSESGRRVTVRSQRLVIAFTATLGNYDYTFKWCFYQDASIKLEVTLDGIINPNVMAPGANPGGHGTVMTSQIDGTYHQHFVTVRIDTEIDGNKNSVSTVDVVSDPAPTGSSLNPYGNGFIDIKTPLTTASQARSKISPLTARSWIISGDTSKLNPVTKTPMGYSLIPDNTPPLMMRKDSPLHAKCAFVDYDVWVTPYQENQFYAGGYYLNNSGLPEWVGSNPNANVQNTDIVLWHVFGFTHIPRVEDFPVMPSMTIGFWLKPNNFFTQNPALDVPGFASDPSS